MGPRQVPHFLARYRISEVKPIGELTERQRHLLARQLELCSQTQNEIVSRADRTAGR